MGEKMSTFVTWFLGLGFISGLYFVRRYRRKLKTTEQANRELISNIAHELKTPMTSIIGFVDTLQNGAIRDPEKAANFLDIISIETGRLGNIIDETLELSRLDNLKQDNNQAKFSADGAVEEVVIALESIAAQDNISIKTFYTDSEETFVFANKVRIKQILTNIIGNAIKYNIPDGKVEITVSRIAKNLIVKVYNTGRGIKNEHFASLFDRFYRVDDGRSRDVGGTGLGLSIVKKIIKLYNGKIEVESIPNESATFTISLPICV